MAAGENKIRLFLTLVFVAAGVICGSRPESAFAQASEVERRLASSIEQTRRQLEAEKLRIEREEKSQENELKEVSAEQGRLVDEKVERKFAIAEKEARLEELVGEREKLLQQRDRFRQQYSEMRIIAGDAYQKLSELLGMLPISESRDRQEELLEEVKASLVNSDETAVDIEALLELVDSVLDESRSSTVFSAQIRNAEGYVEQVRLLRVGQILFAYNSPTSERVGIAVGAGDEKGFRWNENIPEWAGRQIAVAINGAEAKGGGIYSLPIDVTQQLTIDQYNGKAGLWQKMAAGGPVMVPLAVVAVLALILIAERFVFLRTQAGDAIAVAEDILGACHRGDYQRAEQIAIERSCIISRPLLACLSRRLEGTAVMEDAISESILHELPKVERFLPLIGILAGVAPLLGLLGTVTGMIATFDTITIFGGGQPRLMAGGISEALVTTATGLAIAIPVLLIHNYLSGRADKLIADTERFSATLLNLLRDETDKSSEKNTGGRKEK